MSNTRFCKGHCAYSCGKMIKPDRRTISQTHAVGYEVGLETGAEREPLYITTTLDFLSPDQPLQVSEAVFTASLVSRTF